MEKVLVNERCCDKIIEILKKIELPYDEEEPTNIELSNDELMNFYFSIVAICHQTTPISGKGLEGFINGELYKGWDYLRQKWLNYTKINPSIIYPEFLTTITKEIFVDILKDDNGSLNLVDIDGRVILLNDIGHKMQENKCKSVQDIYIKSNSYLYTGDGQGLLEQLASFYAYSDPVKKKSLYFLALMKNHLLWTYKDEVNLGPPVDYHEIRGHLRIGSVELIDGELKRKVLQNIEISQAEDVLIRNSVYEAIVYISKKTGISSSTLHYFFWNYFRNCCTRYQPHCNGCSDICKLPQRYMNIKKQLKTNKCLFSGRCNSENIEKIVEPKVWTQYY